MLLEQTDKRRMEVFSNKHVLNLSRMEQEDFGNYSCQAENSVGVRRQTVEVGGQPQPARVISKGISMYRNKYMLEWMVDSLFEITETRILYRSNKVSTKYFNFQQDLFLIIQYLIFFLYCILRGISGWGFGLDQCDPDHQA